MSRSELAVVVPARSPAMMAATAVYDEWRSSLTVNTLRAYTRDIKDLATWLDVPTAEQAVSLLISNGHGGANRLVLAYRVALRDRGLASATIARHISAIRSVVTKAREHGRINWQIDVKAPKVETYRDTRGPGDEGWKAMRTLAARDARGGDRRLIRDRAILRLTHDLGLRVAELVSLDHEHLEFSGPRPTGAWVLRKGKAERKRLTIPEETGKALAKWLTTCGLDAGPLFVRLDTGAKEPSRLSSKSVSKIVAKVAARAGVDRPMSPHKLRHHAISDVARRNGGDLFKTMEFSGHLKSDTVQKYIDNLTDNQGAMAALIADPDPED